MDTSSSSNPADKTVLIVDDEKGIRDLLEIVMQREGFKVVLAGDGEEALEKIRATPPDMVLLDLMLPKYGGFEVLRELQAAGAGDIPIIIMTGRMMDASTSEMIKRESNVSEFMQKPINREVLLARMHQLLKTRPLPKRPGA